MLKSLIIMIALMFTTAALAQEQCKSTTPWSYSDSGINRTESISDINRIMTRLLGRVEFVPQEEAQYIRRELALTFDGKVDLDRLKKLQGRRYFRATLLRDDVTKVMQEAEMAERAATPKVAADYLISILSSTMPDLYSTAEQYKQQGPAVSFDIGLDIVEARFVAAAVLQCIVKGLR